MSDRLPMYCAAEKEHGACEVQCEGCESEQEYQRRIDAAVTAERARIREAVEAFRVPTGDRNSMEGAQNQGYNFALDDVLALLTDSPPQGVTP